MKSFCLQIPGTISQCFLTCRGIASLQHCVVDLEISLNYEVSMKIWQFWTLCLPSVCLFYLRTLGQIVIGISKSIFVSHRLVWTIHILEQWLLTEATALPYWHVSVVTLRICLNSEPLSQCPREGGGGRGIPHKSPEPDVPEG